MKKMIVAMLGISLLAACSSVPEISNTGTSSTGTSVTGTSSLAASSATTSNLAATAFYDSSVPELLKIISRDSNGNTFKVAEVRGWSGDAIIHQSISVLTKFGSDGVKLWSHALGSSDAGVFKTGGFAPSDLPIFPQAVASDPSGNIYVAGTIGGFADSIVERSSQMDAILTKYDPSGQRLWTRTFGSSGNDGATGIKTDGTTLYLSGYGCANGVTFPGGIPCGKSDEFVTTHNLNGDLLSSKLFNSNDSDSAAQIAKDWGGISGFATTNIGYN